MEQFRKFVLDKKKAFRYVGVKEWKNILHGNWVQYLRQFKKQLKFVFSFKDVHFCFVNARSYASLQSLEQDLDHDTILLFSLSMRRCW